MARIAYANLDSPTIAPLAQRITQERGSVLHLYQMLLHSPNIAEGWLSYLTAIRQKSSLTGSLRELVIMRVAVLNGAPYEADQHAPIALAEGISQPQLDALADWESSTVFSQQQRDVLTYTDVMTQKVQVPDSVFQAVAQHFSEKEIIELTATIAAYNMVSRFLEALQVHSSDAR
ncbi:carboxymuconolactone decarboxylase family protein [Lampropedia puyangensis]|uniref:Carboxymuconolactone decarboxylase family protein n=1 Tax=Lampropedia puyangensis TaxID=1330072 RepID=A0A4S8FCE4_9BURK|nr:carboxymuconolactone decarboxylase family protein [Lampropedia puyangensis]THU05288.1 carboxymuconolactone decarboxylase family protein [Lampropedia puyangensis]